ncbi:hypothetical protein LPJ75_001046, partial [Coemansia sp. RSA 2598]
MPDKCKLPFEISQAPDGKASSDSSNSDVGSMDSMDHELADPFRDHALRVLTKPTDTKRAKGPALSQTPDSAVLDRMLELESAIATVKSSIDNQASSYYSVASQIA